MNVSFVAPELAALMQDLVNARVRVVTELRPVVVRGALNVKTDARARFAAQQTTGAYLPHYARSITYDVEQIPHGTSADIGPESGALQGPFGPGVEFGSARHAPMPHLGPALDAETPKLLNAVGDVGVRVISP